MKEEVKMANSRAQEKSDKPQQANCCRETLDCLNFCVPEFCRDAVPGYIGKSKRNASIIKNRPSVIDACTILKP